MHLRDKYTCESTTTNNGHWGMKKKSVWKTLVDATDANAGGFLKLASEDTSIESKNRSDRSSTEKYRFKTEIILE